MHPALALSTTVSKTPAHPAAILNEWFRVRGDLGLALALDARLPPAVQGSICALAIRGQVACVEMVASRCDERGKRLPTWLSCDASERRAFAERIAHALNLAAGYGICRLVLLPEPLVSSFDRQEAKRRIETGQPGIAEDYCAEREHCAAQVYDWFKGSLEVLIAKAMDVHVELCLGGPPIWPDFFPRDDDLLELPRIFAGTPLSVARFTDWQHARDFIAQRQEPNAEEEMELPAASATLPVGALRLADAAGFTLRLPLGVGEASWAAALSDSEKPVVFNFDEHTTPAELTRSYEHYQAALTASVR